ncbi:hypothetical protein COY17_00160 [Candidatus Saccharibacteria bacterium CG_4_10_14_0_2_um_filter_52_9]|nr:MAG: hypothetical protein COY17_00160 [Candidatus Saccharibacteria bacterium CG_4_10_14_0_2_um_filter_52_9]
MNPQDTQPQNQPQYDPKTRVANDLAVMQPDEQVICSIKRHPIGIITAYAMIVFLLTIVAVLAFVVVPQFAGDNSSQASRYGGAVFLVCAIIGMIYGLIANYVYSNNRWIVTSDSLTQISQSSLFDRQSSQLSLHSLEDITAEQNGILTHMFNYGLLKAETAGHRGNFVFTYCPNPNFYAQQILQARETFMQKGGHQGQAVPPVYQEQTGSYNQS